MVALHGEPQTASTLLVFTEGHGHAPPPTGGGRLLTFGFSPQGQLVTKDYPPHALAVIGLLVAASTMCIPLGALGTLITRRLKRGDTAPVA